MTSKTVLTLCLVALTVIAPALADDPPIVSFAPNGVGLNVPLQSDLSIDSYGLDQLLGNGWALDGHAARTVDGVKVARYQTTVQGLTTPAAMPTGQDWLVVIVYKHTGAYAANNAPWFLKHFEDDIRIASLVNDGTGDHWSLRCGDATGAGWTTVASNLVLDVYWNTFKIHYQAAAGSLDFYLNDQLVAADVALGHGRYDVNHIQIEHIGAGTDWFALVQIGPAAPNPRSLDFGHQWVRSHRLTTQGIVLRDDSLVEQFYRRANFPNVLCWENNLGLMDKAKERQGLPWLVG